MKISKLFVIGVFLFLGNCQQIKENHLVGKWRAVEVLEEGKKLTVDVTKIHIEFQPSHYEYYSTLNHKEAGTYYLQSNLLVTKDTLKKEAVEKAVEVTHLSEDSLFIRMNEKGQERILKMAKEWRIEN